MIYIYLLILLYFRFVVDILKNEEREELEQFISEVELEFPEVHFLISRS
jgi:hypothetical protein